MFPVQSPGMRKTKMLQDLFFRCLIGSVLCLNTVQGLFELPTESPKEVIFYLRLIDITRPSISRA